MRLDFFGPLSAFPEDDYHHHTCLLIIRKSVSAKHHIFAMYVHNTNI